MLTLYAIATFGLGVIAYPNYPAEQCWAEAKRLNELKQGFQYTCLDDSQARKVK